MITPNPPGKSKLQMDGRADFSRARRIRAVNRLLQITLGVLAIVLINLLASRYFSRVDLTDSRLYSLAPETLAYIRELREPVSIIVTVPRNSKEPRVHRDLQKLLREYAFAGRRDAVSSMIEVEFVDIFQQRQRAAELANRFQLTQENVILVASSDRVREVRLADLYRVRNDEITAFRGEQVFTSAIIDVASRRDQTVYFLVGHGQMRLDDTDPLRGLSVLESHLRERSVRLAALDLSQVEEVPEDADLVVIPAPQAAIRPEEQEILRRYMNERNGRMIVLIDPGRMHGLDDLFYDWGVMTEDMAVFDAGSDFRSASGDLIIRRMAEHPITEILLEYQITALFGQPRPVRMDPAALGDERLQVVQLLGTSQNSWADRDYRIERNPSFNEGRDLAGPIPIAVVSERIGGIEMGLNIPGGRLIVFGNSDFIANNRFGNFGNRTLFINALNWSIDRNALLNIPPRPFQSYQVVMSEGEIQRALVWYAVLPAIVGIFGLAVFLLRRR